MKKGLIVAVLGIVMIMCGYILSWHNTHDTRYGWVRETKNGKVLVEDVGGELWSFLGEGYKVGDYVKMTINNRGTVDLKDDVIQDVKCGNAP